MENGELRILLFLSILNPTKSSVPDSVRCFWFIFENPKDWEIPILHSQLSILNSKAFQCHPCGILLGTLFAGAGAGANGVAVEQDLHPEPLVVVRALLAH